MDTPHFKNPRVFKAIKAIVFATLLCLCFTTSFVINFLQLVNYVLFKHLFPDFRRWVNKYLQRIIINSMIYVLEWQCPVAFRVSFDSFETQSLFCRGENGFLIVNHGYTLDAFFYWLFGQMTNSLDSLKGFAKSSLKYFPIIGWMFWFNDTIFLERNWQQDEDTINECLIRLKKSKMPYKLLIAPEGTRFTPEKYRISQEFIKKHNLDVKLKHHLLPRVKGFAATLRSMQAKADPHFALYNVEFLSQIDDFYYEPTLANFFAGKPMKVDCYIGKLPDSEIPAPGADDLAYAEYLYKIFELKDKLVEEHKEYGKFPRSIIKVRHPSFWELAKFVFFNIFMTGSVLMYMIYWAFVLQSLLMKLAIFGYFAITISAIVISFKMMQVSTYGTKNE